MSEGTSAIVNERAGHSPGPWKLVLATFGGSYVQGFSVTPAGMRVPIASVAIAEPPVVAVLAPEYRNTDFAHEHYTPEALEANARLIAAAPDLIDDAQEVADILDSALHDDMPETVRGAITGSVNVLRLAIAKAEGGAK